MIKYSALTVCVLLTVSHGTTGISQIATRGDPITLSWSAPTAREDGTTLNGGDIGHYTLWWLCDTQASGSVSVPGDRTQIVVDTTSIWGRCLFAMSTTDTDGRSGSPSAAVSILLKLPKPARGGFQ